MTEPSDPVQIFDAAADFAPEVAIPKLRQGSYFLDWPLERRRRAERALTTVVKNLALTEPNGEGATAGMTVEPSGVDDEVVERRGAADQDLVPVDLALSDPAGVPHVDAAGEERALAGAAHPLPA